ncbi:hypothetical protein PR003_g19855 [Phytophthora rubi]|nr:hypothetical protein PR001_g17897 [Phytophthora rubi]KAE9312079.1 hypothetical protein PR003_g19855 [Phytophthora rubi]
MTAHGCGRGSHRQRAVGHCAGRAVSSGGGAHDHGAALVGGLSGVTVCAAIFPFYVFQIEIQR